MTVLCPICKQPVFVSGKKDFVICCKNAIFVINKYNDEAYDTKNDQQD